MPTFNLGKPIDDVIDPELMPKDWYPFTIYKEPTQEPNKVLKAGDPTADKAGHNVVVDVRCIDESEHRGRIFRIWLGLPGVGDKERTNPTTGATTLDDKVKRNAKFALDFGGVVEGEVFSISLGGTGMLFVTQGMDLSGQNMVNSIDIFAGSRAIETEEPTEEAPFE